MSNQKHSSKHVKDSPVVVVESRDNSMEKIRDILFGSQSREIELRLAQIEGRIQQSSDDLRKEFDARIAQVESFARKETEKLTHKYQQERDTRNEENKALERLCASMQKDMNKRFTALDDQLNGDTRELRTQMQATSKQLQDGMTRLVAEIRGHIDNENRRMQDDKVGRQDLADLMTELALRLRREFDVPSRKR